MKNDKWFWRFLFYLDKYSSLQTLCVLYIETLLPFNNVVHERHCTLSHVMYLIDFCSFFAEKGERLSNESETVLRRSE